MSQDIASFAPRVAVLIDAENVSYKHASAVIEKVKSLNGKVQFRAYGRKTACKGWLEALEGKPVYRTSPLPTGKPNTADITLMLDAMVYVLRHGVSHICVVSSDTDFVALMRHLKSYGCKTTVLGESKSKKPLRKACDEFVLLKKA
ncbi:MAG: NYN domain-containing protein [Anderseniella sp.]|nr:NYN domain-containing protein [Anderseniella sp.]